MIVSLINIFMCVYRAPGINLETFHGSNKKDRLRSLAKIQRRGGVLMTSYGLVVTNWETLGTKDGQEFIWVSGCFMSIWFIMPNIGEADTAFSLKEVWNNVSEK